MELKRVKEVELKGYAKKDEISRKELKKFTPTKWIVASTAGLVTLFYTSPKNGIQKIGVVFGCVSINYPMLITNSIMNIFGFASGGFGIFFIAMIINFLVNKKKYDEDKKVKAEKHLKILATILIALILVTIISFVASNVISNIETNQPSSLKTTDGVGVFKNC